MALINKKIEEALEQVQKDGYNLYSIDVQTIEICKAAFHTSGEDVLKAVDPELRTVSLLESLGIDNSGYENDSFEYNSIEDWYTDNDEDAYVFLYGKCSKENIEASQRILRRNLEGSKKTWEAVWTKNPLDADNYIFKFSPQRDYFEMLFQIDGTYWLSNLSDTLFNYYWENEYVNYSEETEFFYYGVSRGKDFVHCDYYIERFDDDFNNVVKHKQWVFETGCYDDWYTPVEARIDWIKKRFELWLAEGDDDIKITQLKNDLKKLNKYAVKKENQRL